jgi:hypothetical protein
VIAIVGAGGAVVVVGVVVVVSCGLEPQPAATSATDVTNAAQARFTAPISRAGTEALHPAYSVGVSVIALVLLAAAVALLAAAEWPRLSRRLGLQERAKARKRSHLRVVEPEDDSDEFARAVERDLANLPTFDPRAKRD